jgi:predicted nucleic acid-binding protein
VILVDTSGLFAALDPDQRDHEPASHGGRMLSLLPADA